MSTVVRRSVFVVLTALSAACGTTRAARPADRPALEVPPPPPRVITPAPVPETAQAPEPVGELPTTAKPPVRPRPQPTKEPVKPDPKPEAPAETTIPPVVPPAPPPQLRMPESGDASARHVRDIIERTRRMLSTIDYGPLSDLRKKAYEDAKLFAQQAEDALKLSNLVFAKELADKAERLAKELQSR